MAVVTSAIYLSYVTDPTQTLFWTGAGISRPAPSLLPLGDELTQTIVEATCIPGTWAQAQEYFRRAHMRDESERIKLAPRLETIIEHLDRPLGGRVVEALLPLADAEPNDFHRFFAEHLAQGGMHVTANIDEQIEEWCRRISAPEPFAFHGRLRGRDEQAMRATMSRLPASFRGQPGEHVRGLLARARRLIFLGYSGRDYFDVEPFFRDLKGDQLRLDGLEVSWIAHTDEITVDRTFDWTRTGPLDGKSILRSLEAVGAEVTYREAPTSRVISELASQFGLAATSGSGSGNATTWLQAVRDALDLTDEERLLATAAFWPPFNVGPPLLELEREAQSLPSAAAKGLMKAMLDPRHQGRSGVGRYRDAVRLAGEVEDSARRNAVQAAYERIRGAHLSSGIRHARALRAYQRRDTGDFAARSAEIEYLFWYRDIRLAPIGRATAALWRLIEAPPRFLRSVARSAARFSPTHLYRELARAEEYLDHHPHAVDQLVRLRRDIPELAADPLPLEVLSRHSPGGLTYLESDSIGGFINREREEMVEAIERDAPDLLSQLNAHRERVTAIGDRPGYLKASSLLRRAGAPVDFPGSTLRFVQWTMPRKAAWSVAWFVFPAIFGRRNRGW